MALHTITVSIGSNVATRAEEVSRALVWLRRFMPSSLETTPYETDAESMDANGYHTNGDLFLKQPEAECTRTSYLNAVVRGRTPYSDKLLLNKFKAYERLRGRTDADKDVGKIIIDIDLVEYGGKILDTNEFNSPHFKKGYLSLS